MRYVNYKSLSWLAAFIPLVAGVFVAFEPIHVLTAWVTTINSITGGMAPAPLIAAGLAGIGLSDKGDRMIAALK